MGLVFLLALGIAPQLIAARNLQVRQSVTCDFEIAANSGDTCATFAAGWGLTESAFAALNPGVSCPGDLVAGQDYCILGTATAATSTSTTSTSTTSTSTTTSSTSTVISTTPVTTPVATTSSTSTKVPTTLVTTTTSSSSDEPTQSGLAANCDNFHLVVSNDTCSVIESQYGISAADFGSWNPYIDSDCDNLWLGYYVCVGVPGSTATAASPTISAAAATATATSSGPTPQMPDIVSNCSKYYQVQSGDGCWAIEQAESITSDEFLAWNPFVDTSCDNLWLGYYVCVGV